MPVGEEHKLPPAVQHPMHISDPKAQALFETVAEVLGGAMKALEDYQKRSEPAWQPTASG